jgi:hypothetical protein
LSCASTSGRTCPKRTFARRSPPATWDSFTRVHHRISGRWSRRSRRRVGDRLHVAVPLLPQSRYMGDEQR